MKITPEMIAEDELRWHARDVITELGYCGNAMRDRKDMTNLDIRFYAYLMRKAHDMLKAQEPRVMTLEELHPDLWIWMEYPGEEEGYDNYIGYAYLEERKIENWWFLTAGAKERLACPLKSYGQVWRVWTSRPTPEQMRNTPWEETDNG